MALTTPGLAPVDPPRVAAPRGLLDQVPVVGGDRWEAGTTWEAVAAVIPTGELDLCTPGSFTASSVAAVGAAHPMLVKAGDACSTFDRNRTFESRRARALEALERTRSFQIAREMWRGTLAQASPFTAEQNYLSNDVAAGGNFAGTTQVQSLAALPYLTAEAAIGRALWDELHGAGMIFAPPEVFNLWVHAQYLTQSGARYFDPMGHQVVSDFGFDGNDKAGAQPGAGVGTFYVYAASPVQVRLSEVMWIGDDMSQVTNRTTNRVSIVAQQLAVYEYDNHAVKMVAAVVDTATEI